MGFLEKRNDGIECHKNLVLELIKNTINRFDFIFQTDVAETLEGLGKYLRNLKK